MKLAILLAVCCACAQQTTDPRDGTQDETLAFITETILAPTCGTAECHSSLKRAYGYVFDSVEAAQNTLETNALLLCTGVDDQIYDPCDASADPTGMASENVALIVALGPRAFPDQMPYDQPMPNKNIQFLVQWIVDGANGYVGNSVATH